jgi:hypothetical protein
VGTSKGDHTALVTIALDADRTLYIVDIERFRQSGNYTARRIVELSQKYHYQMRYIDNDLGSQQWVGTFREVCRSMGEGNTHIKMVPMKNRDKESRAQTFRAMLWEDRVRLCPGPMAADFMMELADFPGCSRGSPDMIDAISTVCNELPKLSGGSVYRDNKPQSPIKPTIQEIDGQQFTVATLGELTDDYDSVLSLSSRRSRRI